jgi:predicted nucleic acid-binding protein
MPSSRGWSDFWEMTRRVATRWSSRSWALGSITQRDVVLDMLANLYRFPVLTHDEVLQLVDRRRLWGRGLSTVDANLLGSVSLVAGARLWTRDKRLQAAAEGMGVLLVDEP